MRITRFILLVSIAIIVLATGCSRKQTYVAPGGKVTVNEKNGQTKTVEVVTDQGKATIDVEKKTITEKELGAPVYPGAKVEVSGNYEGAGQGQHEQMQHTMLTTPDDFDKVVEFYKSKLKNVTNSVNQNMGDGKMAMFTATAEGGSEVTIQIMTDKDKKVTRIQVMKMQKPKQ